MYAVGAGGDVLRFHEYLGWAAEFVYGATQWERCHWLLCTPTDPQNDSGRRRGSARVWEIMSRGWGHERVVSQFKLRHYHEATVAGAC
jgi:hypothetical protein